MEKHRRKLVDSDKRIFQKKKNYKSNLCCLGICISQDDFAFAFAFI